MLAIIRMIIVGFVVGVLAKLLVLGNNPIGFWKTALLGVIGSLVAGLVVFALNPKDRAQGFHPAGFIASLIGAIVVLVLAMHFHWLGQ